MVWMVIECGVAMLAAERAHSPALLAFGSDSVVELLSGSVVLLQFLPRISISEARATRITGLLLFVLATIVLIIAALSLTGRVKPESSPLGIALTVTALLIMTALGWMKRKEARRLNNPALKADAVQSATCAYLAGVTLIGLSLNASLQIGWFDSAAALVAVPLLVKEGTQALRNQPCSC